MSDKNVNNINYVKQPAQKMPSLMKSMKAKKSYEPLFNYKPNDFLYKKITGENEERNREVIEKLYSNWSFVMREEAKNHIDSIKPDPKISKKFFQELVAVAEGLNCNPEDLAAAIYRESHFDPTASTPSKKYRGLIQMDEQALKDSLAYAVKTGNKNINPKITFKQYAKLPREKQIKYVEAYLRFRINEQGLEGKVSGGQLYTLIHVPFRVDNSREVRKHQKYINEAKKVPSDMKKQLN